jgi:hypothetical protein
VNYKTRKSISKNKSNQQNILIIKIVLIKSKHLIKKIKLNWINKILIQIKSKKMHLNKN